jgi:hypothetical protein
MNKMGTDVIKQILAVNKIQLNKDKFMLWVTFKDVYDDKYDGYLTADLEITNIAEKGLGLLDPNIKKFSTIAESDIYVNRLTEMVSWREDEDNFILLTVKFNIDGKFDLDEAIAKLNAISAKTVMIGKPNDDSILTSIDDARQFRDRLISIQNIIGE